MMLAMALLVAAPAARTTLAARAHGLRPGALVNYSVLHIHQASWEGFGQQIPSPLQLLRQQPAAVLQGIRRKARANARALGLFPGPLFLLPLLSWPGALRRRRDPAAAVPPLEAEAAAADGRQPTTAAELRRVWWVLAGANLAFYCASWVAAGALRYLLPTTTLLLPLLLAAGFRRAGHSSAARSMAVVLVAGTLLLLAGYWHTHCQWMQRRWQPAGWEPYHVAARWIAAVTGPDEVVASNNPWMIHADAAARACLSLLPPGGRPDGAGPHVLGALGGAHRPAGSRGCATACSTRRPNWCVLRIAAAVPGSTSFR